MLLGCMHACMYIFRDVHLKQQTCVLYKQAVAIFGNKTDILCSTQALAMRSAAWPFVLTVLGSYSETLSHAPKAVL